MVKADENGQPTEELLIPQGTTYSIIHDTKKASSTGVVGENGIFIAEVSAWLGADVILVPSYFLMLRRISRK